MSGGMLTCYGCTRGNTWVGALSLGLFLSEWSPVFFEYDESTSPSSSLPLSLHLCWHLFPSSSISIVLARVSVRHSKKRGESRFLPPCFFFQVSACVSLFSFNPFFLTSFFFPSFLFLSFYLSIFLSFSLPFPFLGHSVSHEMVTIKKLECLKQV